MTFGQWLLALGAATLVGLIVTAGLAAWILFA